MTSNEDGHSMMRSEGLTHATPRTVGLFGSGTIGSGWAAMYLAHGYHALVCDPSAGAEQDVRSFLDRVWSSVTELGIPGTTVQVPHHRMRFVDADTAASGADFVHESGPEEVVLKRGIYHTIEESAAEDLVICSSSGGLMPSLLQAEMRHPERLVVAHPFSPVYALPLVEILAGQSTSPKTVDWAMLHFRELGKKPILLKKEVPGYLTNRLTFALVREAVHCLVEGVADARAIEDAVVYGVGPRYIATGGLTSLALAGGPAGMTGVMQSFAAAIDDWWVALGTPRMNPQVQQVLIGAADEILAGRSISDIADDRDAKVVALVKLLYGQDGRSVTRSSNTVTRSPGVQEPQS